MCVCRGVGSVSEKSSLLAKTCSKNFSVNAGGDLNSRAKITAAMAAAAEPSTIKAALLAVLCHGKPVYTTGYVGWGTPGLFSMMNSVANELLFHVYRGERPQDVTAFYEGTRFLAYGNASLSTHFAPWSCREAVAGQRRDPQSWAVPTLLGASRYAVASQLVHLMFTPSAAAAAHVSEQTNERRFSLAVHLRRGDKLNEQRNAERIEVWSKERVVAASAKLLDESWRRATGGAGGRWTGGGRADASSTGNSAPTHPASRSSATDAATMARLAAAVRAAPLSLRPRVLLASDDNGFASTVEAELRSALGVDVYRLPNEHDRGGKPPAEACDEGCIEPLQTLTRQFGRADALMVSSKSNMGSFLVTWWGAANGDATAPMVDMDGKLHRAQLQRGRYFCHLNWGSRRGMCEANRTSLTMSGEAKAASTREHLGERLAERPASVSSVHNRTGSPSTGAGLRDHRRQLPESMCGAGPRATAELALIRVLCSENHGGYAALPPPITRDGVVGLFSQLNQLAHELLVRAYRGEGPQSIHGLHRTTKLVGYGGGPLAEHFSLGFACPAPGSEAATIIQGADSTTGAASGTTCTLPSHADAVAALRRTPRFLAVGALLRLVFTPRHAEAASGNFDLAAHIRRGDRIEGWQRTVEKIEVWPPAKLLAQIQTLLGSAPKASPVAAAAPPAAATPAGTIATAARNPPRVLLASDDNAYLRQLATLGRAAGISMVLLENPDAQHDGVTNRSLEAAKVCGASCVANALGILTPFARAERLILSSKSNLGGYLLSWWGAANAGQPAPGALFDLDHALRKEALPRRYFCDLPWGSRRGLCAPGQNACDMPQFATRSFCKGKGKGGGGSSGVQGKGGRASK